MNFTCLKDWDPSGSWFPKLTSDLFLQAKVRENNPANSPANTPGNNPGNTPGNNPGNSQLWYVDSGCSRHMTGEKSNFLSLTATEGGSVAFGNGKSGTIVGIGKVGESLSHSIDSVYLVDGLKHNLLSVSQLCDKDNLVVFSPSRCLVAVSYTHLTLPTNREV